MQVLKFHCTFGEGCDLVGAEINTYLDWINIAYKTRVLRYSNNASCEVVLLVKFEF